MPPCPSTRGMRLESFVEAVMPEKSSIRRIAVDAMGGDRAPGVVIEGCLKALQRGDLSISLVGPARKLRRELGRFRAMPDKLRLVDASEVIAMDEAPVNVLRRKKNSSMALAAQMVAHREADAMVTALKSSRQDIRRETEARITAARARVDRVGRLLDAAYEDKLEGRIDEAFFQRKRAEWEDQRAAAQRELERLTLADDSSLDLGLRVFELANRAYDLYIEQQPSERAKLLEVLLSNCTMTDGELTPTYRKPFDILVDLANESQGGSSKNDPDGGGCQEWHPRGDSNA